ncbi:MAG: energy-coupling factor ABC transporter ATP-binding protein [Candidatus Helarchaeota archaeon]
MDDDWIITVKDLNFKYSQRKNHAFKLENISFKIKKGEKFALSGPNGSGKTTILRLLVNLNKRDSGEIFINGVELKKKTEWEIRKKIGYLFQNPEDQIFSPTVREEVAFGPRNLGYSEDEVKDIVYSSLKAVEMLDYINNVPVNLSFGQKKRVALAAILAMKPEILLLDEPFVNLDNHGVLSLLRILEKLRKEQDLTIIFTSHDYHFIESYADKILVLNSGKAIFYGSPKEGFSQKRIIDAIGNFNAIKDFLNQS